MLYSREPRSSVCPSTVTVTSGLAARYSPWAMITSRSWPWISLESNAKWITRTDSRLLGSSSGLPLQAAPSEAAAVPSPSPLPVAPPPASETGAPPVSVFSGVLEQPATNSSERTSRPASFN